MTISKPELYKIVRDANSGVVSTIGAKGEPQAAHVYLAITPELELIFYTLETNRKCLNLRRDPRIAAVIAGNDKETVQYEGVAKETEDADLEDARQTFLALRPERSSQVNWPGLTFFRVKPVWIRFSHYGETWRVDELIFPENKPKERQPRLGLFRRGQDS